MSNTRTALEGLIAAKDYAVTHMGEPHSELNERLALAWNNARAALAQPASEDWGDRTALDLSGRPIVAQPAAAHERTLPQEARAAFEKWYDAQPDGKLNPWDVFKAGHDHAVSTGHACVFALDGGGNIYRRYRAPQCADPRPATERTPQDYAIEHAEYMATTAERLLAEISLEGEALTTEDLETAILNKCESIKRLHSDIYEFRKRRDRALAATKEST